MNRHKCHEYTGQTETETCKHTHTHRHTMHCCTASALQAMLSNAPSNCTLHITQICFSLKSTKTSQIYACYISHQISLYLLP